MGKDFILATELPDYVEQFIDSRIAMGRSKETLRRYSVYFATFQTWLKGRPLMQPVYDEYIKEMCKQHTEATVRSLVAQFDRFHKWLFETGVTNLNFSWNSQIVLRRIYGQRKTEEIQELGNLDDVLDFYEGSKRRYEELQTSQALRAYGICEFLYRLGLRVSELLVIQAGSVGDDGLVTVEIRGKQRSFIGCNFESVQLLKGCTSSCSDYLLNPGVLESPVSVSTISADIRRVGEYIGYDGKMTAKTFRKAAIRELVREGRPYYAIASLMGCSDYKAREYIWQFSDTVGEIRDGH